MVFLTRYKSHVLVSSDFSLFADLNMMTKLEKKIGGFIGEFTFREHELLINVSHPTKPQVLFNRLTNDIFPAALREISDDILELVDVIREIPDDKILIGPDNELVLVISMGKKSKQYAIPMERAEMSSEDSLRKRVEELQKNQEKLLFEAAFFKEQYLFLLKHLSLRPEVGQLEKFYGRGNLEELVCQSQMKQLKLGSSMSSSIKVGSRIKMDSEMKGIPGYKCPNLHPLSKSISDSNKCNVCAETILKGKQMLNCVECGFYVCQKCQNIPPQQRKYCPDQHALIFGKANSYQLRLCDHCRKSLGLEKKYSCFECDYDLCKDCVV